jgi:hypothetical protein
MAAPLLCLDTFQWDCRRHLLDQFKEIYLRQKGKWGPPPEAWYLGR